MEKVTEMKERFLDCRHPSPDVRIMLLLYISCCNILKLPPAVAACSAEEPQVLIPGLSSRVQVLALPYATAYRVHRW